MKLDPRPAVLAASLLVAACSSSEADRGPLPAAPAKAFTALEARLLGASTVWCESHLSAEGAVEADLRCVHALASDGSARLSARGTFAGRPVDLELVADGRRLVLRTPAGERELPAAADLHSGLVLGLTRMGWLHNVAMLATGNPPDGTDGRMDAFARVVGIGDGQRVVEHGVALRTLRFEIEVEGLPAGTATLLLDEARGLPLERWQRVVFPQGELRVVEVYERLALDVDLARPPAGP